MSTKGRLDLGLQDKTSFLVITSILIDSFSLELINMADLRCVLNNKNVPFLLLTFTPIISIRLLNMFIEIMQ